MTGKKQHYHIVGAAGVGMNCLAQLLLAGGCRVTGSDRFADMGEDLPVLDKLRSAGMILVPQDGRGVAGPDTIVVSSTAVEKDNADLDAARRLGASVVHRARMLAQLAGEGRECVAVTGTSGKTTVTGMIGWILESLGADPTVVNGGNLLNWISEAAIGNVRAGGSGLWVVEADESDKSLMNFRPDWAVITNVGKDHFSEGETKDLFAGFSSQVRRGVIRGTDGPGACRVSEETFSGTVFERGGVRFRLSVPGRHNVENALHAITMCDRLGYAPERVAPALESFRGIERRLQLAGYMNGTAVIDDFAHNPAKIRAAWTTVAAHYRRVFAVWRPHGFKPLEFMLDELVDVIASVSRPADQFCVLPVYYAGGTVDRKVDSWTLVGALRERNVQAFHVNDYQAAVRHVCKSAEKGDAVVVMGARDPNLPRLALAFVARNRT